MSPFNDSVERPSIKKKPSASGTNTTNNLVKLSSLGLLGFGVLILYSLSGGTAPTGHNIKDIVSILAAYETSANCANSGCIKVQAGATKDGTIFTTGTGGGFRVAPGGDPGRTPICELSRTGSLQGTSCSIAAGVTLAGALSTTNADARYLKKQGDTATGAMTLNRSLSVSGAIVSESLARIPRILAFPLCDGVTACATGSGVAIRIPKMMHNFILSGATLDTATLGTTGTMTVQVFNVTDGVNFFSTAITLDSAEPSSDTAATPAVINASNRTVTDGDIIEPKVTGVHTTPSKGTTLNLLFVPN
ncbi:hypothetical protein KW797_00010 [Candidatus Parcubacteria bacterium]|nr:hypothetical protein [Candidatus Parcubacteria bacterium]